MYSAKIRVHQTPTTLIRFILGLASLDERALGFDDNIYWGPDGNRRLNVNIHGVVESLPALQEAPLFFRMSIRGRGTIAWSVDYCGSRVLVKYAWRAIDRKPELEFLECVKKAGLKGVGQLIFGGEAELRRMRHHHSQLGTKPKTEVPIWISDRQYCYLVMKHWGRCLDHFTTKLELLTAFRDAIAGHRALLEIGILHRDVSLRNILLGDPNDVGNRGILIDLDLALEVGRASSNVVTDFRTGTRTFQSLRILSGGGHHNYFDDLESFFYILCWIYFCYE
ncbi:hypothetical protein JAAARDRAFT_692235, partial [Jaapia argillacea MUCL 33604]